MNINDNDEELERIKIRALERLRNKIRVEQIRSDSLKNLNGTALDLTDSNFFSTIGTYPMMLVDFWAPWCGPCRKVSPVVDELAQEYSGRIAFGRVNVDENQMVANSFRIQSIPTLLIFKNGKAVDGILGAYPKSFIESRLNDHLGNGFGVYG
jgi:thioredoxin 1